MIRITPEHIYVLRDSTGKPFTDLLDRLIRCSAGVLGIPPTEVLDNPRTNHPDGGVDTQVTTVATLPDPWTYFNERSAWQYKAVELTDLSDSKVREEISGKSKDYVRSLLEQGNAYRMCIAHDGPPEKKAHIKGLWLFMFLYSTKSSYFFLPGCSFSNSRRFQQFFNFVVIYENRDEQDSGYFRGCAEGVRGQFKRCADTARIMSLATKHGPSVARWGYCAISSAFKISFCISISP
jgi:hypothetical protein